MKHSKTRDDSRQRTLTGHLNRYTDAVIACVGDAESILIFGPGEQRANYKNALRERTSATHRIC